MYGSPVFSSRPARPVRNESRLAELQNDNEDPHLKFVSITCDPKNDTPEVLAKYARSFQADPARWSFLSGPFESVQKLGTEAFQVPVGPKMHTQRVILVDKWSNVRGLYLTSDPSQVLALKKKIKKLLAEETPPAATEEANAATGETTLEAASDKPASDDATTTKAVEETTAEQSAPPVSDGAQTDAAPEKAAPTEGTP